MNFRSEVPSCAGRPIEAKMWVNDIESAKSVADLQTSYSITGAELQANFKVLDSKKQVVSRRSSTETSKEESSFKKKLHKRKTLLHGKASRMDDQCLQMYQSWTSMIL